MTHATVCLHNLTRNIKGRENNSVQHHPHQDQYWWWTEWHSMESDYTVKR